jgi:hypothetical protein
MSSSRAGLVRLETQTFPIREIRPHDAAPIQPDIAPVSVTAATFPGAGITKYPTGQLTALGTNALEATSRDCYDILHQLRVPVRIDFIKKGMA